MTTVVAITAGLSETSSTRLLTDRLVESLGRQTGDVSVEIVALRELAHDVVDATLTGFASPRLQDVLAEHLQRFAREEILVFDWQPADPAATVSDASS